MLTAIGKNGKRYAWEASKSDGPFVCPGCKWPAILKEGYFVVAHFAHEPGADCPYATYHRGESETHYAAKKDIFTALSTCPGVTDVKLERYIGPVRPDISFRFNGVPIAIEMQVSKIDPRLIEHRTKEYTRRGIYLLWATPWKDIEEGKLQDNRFYDLRSWERYVHFVLHGGRFYYWIEGLLVRPVHFDEARPGYASDPLLVMKQAMMIAHIEEDRAITDLSPVSLSVNYSDLEPIPREAKVWGLPSVWVRQDGQFAPLSEARRRYPSDFLDPAQLAQPSDVSPFTGDPFDESIPVDPTEFLQSPPPVPHKCLEHHRICRYADRFGHFYCNHPVCWSRYHLLLRGFELSYPEVLAVIDPRDYLPDVSAEPVDRPSPVPDSQLTIPIYPALPPRTQLLIESGENAWRAFSETASYEHIALALKTVDLVDHLAKNEQAHTA